MAEQGRLSITAFHGFGEHSLLHQTEAKKTNRRSRFIVDMQVHIPSFCCSGSKQGCCCRHRNQVTDPSQRLEVMKLSAHAQRLPNSLWQQIQEGIENRPSRAQIVLLWGTAWHCCSTIMCNLSSNADAILELHKKLLRKQIILLWGVSPPHQKVCIVSTRFLTRYPSPKCFLLVRTQFQGKSHDVFIQ